MKTLILVLAFAGAGLFAPTIVQAQSGDARAVLDAALRNLGGETKIRSFTSLYYSAKGTENGAAAAQADDPGKDSSNAHEERLAVFLDRERLAYEYKTDRGDGTTRWRRFMFTGDRRIVADFGTRSVYSSSITSPSVDRDQDTRRIPHLLLLEALASAATLRYEGMRSVADRANELITITFANTTIPVSLYFDKQTKLLSKYEYQADFPGLGNVTIEYFYTNYRPHPQLGWFAAEHSIRIDGKVWRSIKYDHIEVDGAEADAMMQLPPELEGFVTPPGTVKEIAPGVFFVYGAGGSFQPMFIEFKDFILAVEAPANQPSVDETPLETIGNVNAVTDEFIAKIKQTVPNKPIRYVVITHCHSDHMGGLRAFGPEHPTVLTSPGNRAFYERFVPGLKIEIFDGKRVISDGQRVVELINVGSNPHTRENIVVYLPLEKYLFQGDLFYFGGDASFPAKDRMTVMPFFARWLKHEKLSPVRIYGFHSVLFGTMEHIEKVLALSPQPKL